MTVSLNRAAANDVSQRAKTGGYAVLGYCIGYSRSPKIFRRVFAHLKWPATYEILDLTPREFGQFFRSCRSTGFVGLNVTVPYKTRVIKFLDQLDEAAGATGAVNTITVNDGCLSGFNTDVDGIALALYPYRRRLLEGAAIILGAGGAARAVACALAQTFSVRRITFAARSLRKGRFLVNDLGDRWNTRCEFEACAIDKQSLKTRLPDCDLLVNATPLGGRGSRSSSPLPRGVQLQSIPVVFDLIYQPRVTRFMRQAQEAGCRSIVGGWPMLVGQADAAFRLWTGRSFPVSVKRELLRSEGRL